jgi:hypothetical protein
MPFALASMRSRSATAAALQPIAQGLKAEFGATGADAGRGLILRMDNGTQYTADDFLNQVKFWGITPSFAFVAEPQTNGVADRFNRTLKEQVIHGRLFRNLEEVRAAVTAFMDRYNRHWRLETECQRYLAHQAIDKPCIAIYYKYKSGALTSFCSALRLILTWLTFYQAASSGLFRIGEAPCICCISMNQVLLLTHHKTISYLLVSPFLNERRTGSSKSLTRSPKDSTQITIPSNCMAHRCVLAETVGNRFRFQIGSKLSKTH